ncbi:hypothetical protein B0H11DRAFT_2186157 [Mycena galericulata]|nr:hypothetical protein B0H11DRAFT_2186157 [Mycena galericulata]
MSRYWDGDNARPNPLPLQALQREGSDGGGLEHGGGAFDVMSQSWPHLTASDTPNSVLGSAYPPAFHPSRMRARDADELVVALRQAKAQVGAELKQAVGESKSNVEQVPRLRAFVWAFRSSESQRSAEEPPSRIWGFDVSRMGKIMRDVSPSYLALFGSPCTGAHAPTASGALRARDALDECRRRFFFARARLGHFGGTRRPVLPFAPAAPSLVPGQRNTPAPPAPRPLLARWGLPPYAALLRLLSACSPRLFAAPVPQYALLPRRIYAPHSNSATRSARRDALPAFPALVRCVGSGSAPVTRRLPALHTRPTGSSCRAAWLAFCTFVRWPCSNGPRIDLPTRRASTRTTLPGALVARTPPSALPIHCATPPARCASHPLVATAPPRWSCRLSRSVHAPLVDATPPQASLLPAPCASSCLFVPTTSRRRPIPLRATPVRSHSALPTPLLHSARSLGPHSSIPFARLLCFPYSWFGRLHARYRDSRTRLRNCWPPLSTLLILPLAPFVIIFTPPSL